LFALTLYLSPAAHASQLTVGLSLQVRVAHLWRQIPDAARRV